MKTKTSIKEESQTDTRFDSFQSNNIKSPNERRMKIDQRKKEMLLAELESSPDEEVTTPSELKEAIHEMNRDDDEANGFSSIDMRTILHPQELRSLIVIDMLTHMNVLPKQCGAISRKFKRLKVSEEGKGREQNVAVINGIQEQKAGVSRMKALGNYIGLGGGNK